MSWLMKDGEQLKLRTTGQPVQMYFVENFGFTHYPQNGEMLKFIDAVANSGANGIRVFGFFPFGRGREEEPYVRSGGRFDLNRPNPEFYNYLRQWMGYAQQRGVVILYELFDSVGLKIPRIAPYHPFGEFNDGDLHAFSELSNHRMVAYQKKYLEQIVNALKAFPNVILAIMNEYEGEDNWHYEMSRHVKSLAPNHLIAGSAEYSEAINDPSADIWFSHCGSYDRDQCRSNMAHDVANIRSKARGKIVGYSTDGFGLKGMKCENPDAMRRLAQDAKDQNLQLFSFLDHYAYVDLDESGKEYPVGTWYREEHIYELSRANRANVQTYQAIAQVFPATPLVESRPVELPKGFLKVFDASYLDSTHPNVTTEKGGKAVAATKTQGYLCRTSQIAGLPSKALEAGFSIFVDNNTYDDDLVLILDVFDAAQKKVLAIQPLTRKSFPKAQQFNLLKLAFTPPQNAQIECRVYYFGHAYVVVDKLAIVEPDKAKLTTPDDIPDLHSGIPSPGTPAPPPTTEPPAQQPSEPQPTEGLLSVFDVSRLHSSHPDAFYDKGGKAIRATTTQGFLAYGQYATGYPAQALEACFSLFIDNNMADNRRVVTIDVYDSYQNKVLAQQLITRQQFPVAGKFTLFKLSFTPVTQSNLEFRIYYNGWTYLAADKIAVVDPKKLQLRSHDDLAALSPGTTPAPPPGPTTPMTPPGDAVLAESLKDGKTSGRIKDGNLTAAGLQFQGGNAFLGYTISTLPRGYLEFSARGFAHDELHGGTEYKGVLVTMWDGQEGYDYDRDPFIFEMRKYGYIEGRPDASNSLWFKIKSNGEWTENHKKPFSWNSNTLYRFRLEWGGGETRVFRNGELLNTGSYKAEFAPSAHCIQIGANPLRGRTTPHNLLISDVIIEKL